MKLNIHKTTLKITISILLTTITLIISKISLAAYTPIVGDIGNPLTASDEVIDASGFQLVQGTGEYAGSTYNIIVSDSAIQMLNDYSTSYNTVVNFSGIVKGNQILNNNSISYNTILNGGDQFLLGNSKSYNTTVNFVEGVGGNQTLLDRAISYNTILNCGYQVIIGTAVSHNTVVNNTGIQAVGQNGISYDTVVNNGGTQGILSEAISYNTVVNGGKQGVYELSNSYNTLVNAGGIQELRDASTSHNTVVNSGGYQVLTCTHDTDTLTSNGTIVNSGGSMYTMTVSGINNIVKLSGTTILNSGASLIFSDGRFVDDSVSEMGISSVMPYDLSSKIQVNGGSFVVNYNMNTYSLGGGGTGNMYTHHFSVPVYGNGNIFFGLGEKNNLPAYNKVEFAEINGDFAINAGYTGNSKNLLDRYEDILKVAGGDNNIHLLDNGIAFGLHEYGLSKTISAGVASYTLFKTNNYASYVRATPVIGINAFLTSRILGNSMHKRVGELMWQYENDKSGFDFLTKDKNNASNNFWIRNNIRNITLDRTPDNDTEIESDVFIAELGYDYMLYNSSYGRAYIGILGQFSNAKAELTPTSGASTDIELDSKAIGLYGMWLGKGGYFADLVVRQHFIDQNVNTKSSLGDSLLEYDTNQEATTLNFEIGREIVFGGKSRADLKKYKFIYNLFDLSTVNYDNYKETGLKDTLKKVLDNKSDSSTDIDVNNIKILVNSVYFITPRFQFNMNHTGGDAVNTSLGKITIEEATGYTLSGGLIFGKRFDINKIRGSEINNTLKDNIIAQLYLKVNYLYEYDTEVKTSFIDIEQSLDNDGSRGEIGIGFDARFNNIFALYIDLSYSFNSDYSDKGLLIGGRWAF